jgi:two-component system nitrate/nitrite sensor histidine kinase NarX
VMEHERVLAALAERERLARELHDNFSQVIGFIHVQTQAIGELLARGKSLEAQTALDRLAVVSRDLHVDVREKISRLINPVLATDEFTHALRQRLEQFTQRYGIETKLDLSPEVLTKTLAPEIETHLLQIVQESLANTRKHGCAQHIHVRVTPDTTHMQIVIEDDGVGFDPKEWIDNYEHFGLRLMRDRAAEIEGSLQIDSAPGKGTRVTVQVPTQEKNKHVT